MHKHNETLMKCVFRVCHNVHEVVGFGRQMSSFSYLSQIVAPKGAGFLFFLQVKTIREE